MPYAPGILGPGVGMPMHPSAGLLDPIGMGMMGPPGPHPMGIGMSGYYPGMLGGMRSRHSPYYHQSYGYGSGRGGARYLDSYDLFDDIFDEDVYMNDYDDIDDPLLMWMRMARGGGGGGGRRGRRGRYGRYGGYGGGGLGYHGLLRVD
jgi:hypothetical protein